MHVRSRSPGNLKQGVDKRGGALAADDDGAQEEEQEDDGDNPPGFVFPGELKQVLKQTSDVF